MAIFLEISKTTLCHYRLLDLILMNLSANGISE